MAKYSGSGWHFQSTRHSNARKYGKAGGTYSTATPIYAGDKLVGYFNIVAFKGKTLKEREDYNKKWLKKYHTEKQNKNKKFISDFENMIENAELRALSNTSLQRPLNDKEHDRFMELARKGKLIIKKTSKKHYGKSEFKREKIPISGNLFFWRHPNSSFVEINKVEKNAPAWEQGKYQVSINTTKHLETKYFNNLLQAKKYAHNYIKQNPIG